jgi:hypothetical protein
MEDALSETVDLTLVETFGADRVYEVVPRTFDRDSVEVSAYFPPRAAAGQPYSAYIIAVNHGERSYAVQPTELSEPTVSWQGEELSVPADVPLVTSSEGGVAVVRLPMTAPEAAGTYQVTVREQDGPLGSWSFAGQVVVGAEVDSAFPVPIRLEAWEVPESAGPGHSLPVALRWRALGKIDAYYSVYVKLLDDDGNAIAGWDGQPQNGEAPTLLWVPGEIVEDLVTLAVPVDAPPGEYTVEVGMYRAADLARCLTLDRDGIPVRQVVLGTVRVAD